MKLADVFSKIITPDRRVSFRAYDGSSVGPQDNDVILEIRSPRAVQFLAGAPSQLGLARAYVSGDLEIIGDAYTALSRLYPLDTSHLSWRDKLDLAKSFGPQAVKRPTPPPQERRLRGRRHSRAAMQRRFITTTTSPIASTAGSWGPPWRTRARCSPMPTPLSR